MVKTNASLFAESVNLTWSVHRLRENPRGLVLLVPALALTFWAGASLLGWAIGLAAVGVLVAATGDYFFPVRFTLTEKRAVSQCLIARQEIEWVKVKRALLAEDGVKLSPLGFASRLEAFRGVFLRFNNNRDEVLQAVEQLRKRREEP